MIDLYDWLRTLFTYPEIFHPAFAESLKVPRDKKAQINADREYQFPQAGLSFRMGLVIHEKNFTRLVHYIPDRQVLWEADRKIDAFPLLDCNYTLYGMYLNIAAYLIEIPNAQLQLILACAPEAKITFLYRPEVAQALLSYKAKKDKEEEKRKAGALAHHQAAGPVGLFQ